MLTGQYSDCYKSNYKYIYFDVGFAILLAASLLLE